MSSRQRADIDDEEDDSEESRNEEEQESESDQEESDENDDSAPPRSTSSKRSSPSVPSVRGVVLAAAKSQGRVEDDYTIFKADILDDEKSTLVSTRGKYDTGADDNFISEEIVRRAGKWSSKQGVKDAIFDGLDGRTYQPRYTVKISWYDRAQSSRYREWFYIVKDSPFDLIVGKDFIFDRQIFISSKQKRRTALPLRRKPKSSEQKKREAEIRQKQNENAANMERLQLAQDSAARAQARPHPNTNAQSATTRPAAPQMQATPFQAYHQQWTANTRTVDQGQTFAGTVSPTARAQSQPMYYSTYSTAPTSQASSRASAGSSSTQVSSQSTPHSPSPQAYAVYCQMIRSGYDNRKALEYLKASLNSAQALEMPEFERFGQFAEAEAKARVRAEAEAKAKSEAESRAKLTAQAQPLRNVYLQQLKQGWNPEQAIDHLAMQIVNRNAMSKEEAIRWVKRTIGPP